MEAADEEIEPMELKDVQSLALTKVFQKTTSTHRGQVKGMEHRIQVVEKTTDILVEIQKSLVELTVESRNNGEKMNDLKLMMKDSNSENKKQHDDICARVDILEAKPGKRWETVVGDFIKILIAGGLGYFLAQFGLK